MRYHTYPIRACTYAYIGTLTIGRSVKTIQKYAFSGCSGFSGTLAIPDTVTSIGEYSLSYMTSLCLQSIPDAVKKTHYVNDNRETAVIGTSICTRAPSAAPTRKPKRKPGKSSNMERPVKHPIIVGANTKKSVEMPTSLRVRN